MVLLKAYKSDNGYIGKIDITDLNCGNKSNSDLKFYIILDRSGSMGSNVENFVNKILPKILINLEMEDKEVTLITFDSSSYVYTGDAEYFRNLNIKCQGCTYMTYAIYNLEKILDNLMASKTKQNIRILSISDGELHDQKDTLDKASNLFLKIKNYFIINSQAIRFFTSSYEPDTRGLSSMLQFNTMSTPQLIDINAKTNFDDIANTISELFKNDGMDFKLTLKTSDKIFKENPWNTSQEYIDLINGENIFWMDQIPEHIIIENNNNDNKNSSNKEIVVPIEIGEDITIDNYKTILDKKIDFFMRKLKVLKIVNTKSASNEMKNIIQYFEKFETYLESNSSTLNDIDSIKLQNRVFLLKRLIQKRDLFITQTMKEIQNNEKVNQLNSRQLADFLRTVDSNKDGKSLSKRGLAEGIDFDEVARKEVLEMTNHLDEIKDIDDTHHKVSFYSQSTTLEGIRTVCELTKDSKIFEKITAIDIIKLLNIVGAGCDGYVGNYTDPKIYRLKDIYLGCFVSLSDILSASEYSGGKNNLVDFNTGRMIVNVIPVFEDQRIHKFLLKYAPKLLEYTASIGMRRVLMEVPNTYEFLFESGILKFCQTLNTTRTEAAINLFNNFIESYQVASNRHYDYINHLITKQINEYKVHPENLKYHIYLDDNSVATMTTVFINMIKNNQMTFLPKVLRHLFCHEVHKIVNKMIKNNDHSNDYIQTYLKDLLNIDYDTYGTSLPQLYEQIDHPKFYDQYTINTGKVDEIYKQAFQAMFIPFKPYYIMATMEEDKLNAFKNLKEFNEETIKEYLDIDYDFKYFKTFAIVQAFLYRKNEDRLDTDKKIMKIIDIDDFYNADNMVKKYIKSKYQEDYEKRLAEQCKIEQEMLEDELVNKLLTCDNLTTYKEGFEIGMTKGNTNVKIENIYSPAFIKLQKRIENEYNKMTIPLLTEKISIILLGRDDDDEIVWNNGNVLRSFITNLKNILSIIDPDEYLDVMEKFKKRNIHIYAENKVNRHGHSNELPSYWALGYTTLEEMFASVSQEEIDEYKANHINCCGLRNRY